MSHWEEELQTLLASLGVSYEQEQAQSAASDAPTSPGAHDDLFSEVEQRTLVKREMEATMREVTLLTQAGYLDPAVREDVVRVLRALTRHHPSAGHDWHTTSSAAVLHFCRIVIRLTSALTSSE